MSVGDGFKAHALAPLRSADEHVRQRRLEEAMTALSGPETTRALEFAIDWVSVQLSAPRRRVEQQLPISMLQHTLAQASVAQERALVVLRQHSGGVAAFVGGVVSGFVNAYTGLPVGGAVSGWLGSAAQNARLKAPCAALDVALRDYEAQVEAASKMIERLSVPLQAPSRGVPLHLVAAIVLFAVVVSAIGAWATFNR